MPKLRPSVNLAAITRPSPTVAISAVATSGRRPAASVARRSGGPATDSSVTTVVSTDRSMRRARFLVDKIGRAGGIEQFPRDRRLDPAIAAQRGHLIQQIARVAGAERPARGAVVPPLQVGDHHLVEPQVTAAAVHLEDAAEF